MVRELFIERSDLPQIWELETEGGPPIDAIYVVSDDDHDQTQGESAFLPTAIG